MLQAGIIPVTHFQQNCTVLFDTDTKEGVVVDPGGDVDLILQTIKENGITLKAIWLTHGHIDHAGGAKELKEALNLDIIGPHRDDLPLLEKLETQAEKFGLAMKVENVLPDQWLEDGDTVSFGQHVFEVLHCPGHAPGHVVYFNREQGFAHVGDVLFRGSIGRTDLRVVTTSSCLIPSATRSCRSAIMSASSVGMARAARSARSAGPTRICADYNRQHRSCGRMPGQQKRHVPISTCLF
jgi:hydroxyacylglutathione hydrolase